MIVDALIGLLLDVAELVIGALPEAGDLMLGGFGAIVGLTLMLNEGLPVVETLGMAAMCLTIIGGIFVTRLLLTIWHAVPGKFS